MSVNAIALRVPIVTLVLAATAVPVELQPLNGATISFRFGTADIITNIAGYLMVGIVFAHRGWVRAMAAAVLLSALAEASQLMMMHRVASGVDVAANLCGAMVGIFISKQMRMDRPGLEINRWLGYGAATAALVLLIGMWARAGEPLNARGITKDGILEAHWKFDELDGVRAVDSSERKRDGTLSSGVHRGAGVIGGATVFDGRGNGIDFGRDTAFRLVGSMTISAWIKSTEYPQDDAAIVSSLGDVEGYQLDTTIDRGPRAIGFKLTDPCGEYMARYGATPLVLGVWYHVAGVYDAEKQSLDVYLNGVLDNGPSLGTVSRTQRSSRGRLYVGRRTSRRGYEFAGSIDDVRIYSYALSKSEITAVMSGATVNPTAQLTRTAAAAGTDPRSVYWRKNGEPCGGISDREDSSIPAAAGALGVLVAVACTGLRQAAGSWLLLAAGLAAGLILLMGTVSNLPAFNIWLVPLTSLAGAASVAMSRCRALADVGT